MHLSKRKCQPSLLTGYFLSFRTYSKHLNHLNFETENAKIGPHLLTLSKQKTISVQTVPFLQMYLIPCPEVTFNQKNIQNLEEKNSSVDYRYFWAQLNTWVWLLEPMWQSQNWPTTYNIQKIIFFKFCTNTPTVLEVVEVARSLERNYLHGHLRSSVSMLCIHSNLFTPYFR